MSNDIRRFFGGGGSQGTMSSQEPATKIQNVGHLVVACAPSTPTLSIHAYVRHWLDIPNHLCLSM
jgi:hypothetical protein